MDLTSRPITTSELPWMPLADGVAVRLLRAVGDERSIQLRVDPGVVMSRHRHTGEVHAYMLSGQRQLGTGRVIAAGDYVYEPPGNVDEWRAVGSEPCVIQISMRGRVEVLDDDDRVVRFTDTPALRRRYLGWCAEHGLAPQALGCESPEAGSEHHRVIGSGGLPPRP